MSSLFVLRAGKMVVQKMAAEKDQDNDSSSHQHDIDGQRKFAGIGQVAESGCRQTEQGRQK